jgi:hypothetical protein
MPKMCAIRIASEFRHAARQDEYIYLKSPAPEWRPPTVPPSSRMPKLSANTLISVGIKTVGVLRRLLCGGSGLRLMSPRIMDSGTITCSFLLQF